MGALAMIWRRSQGWHCSKEVPSPLGRSRHTDYPQMDCTSAPASFPSHITVLCLCRPWVWEPLLRLHPRSSDHPWAGVGRRMVVGGSNRERRRKDGLGRRAEKGKQEERRRWEERTGRRAMRVLLAVG